jgi:hypothetical protein
VKRCHQGLSTKAPSIKKVPLPATELNDEVKEAIRKDKIKIEERVKRIHNQKTPHQQKFLVRFMDEPKRAEETISTSSLHLYDIL